jgi:ADP-heptose:LPS heptosyltransferase
VTKILIIKQGALGDIIMITPLLETIRQHHLKDKLWLLTTPAFTDIFSNWPGISVKSIPREGIRHIIKTVVWIRKNHFNRIYDLQSNDRSAILCALSNAPERIGNHPHYPYNIHPVDSYVGQCHIFERMQTILNCAGLHKINDMPQLPVNTSEKERVLAWLKSNDLPVKSFVILHASSSPKHPEKCWPYFSQIGKLLEVRGIRCVWIGAEADAVLNAELSETAGINATGDFTLPELVELGKYARFAITNDSGPMHVLSCSHIPVYAFFGPTNWRRNHAIGQGHNVITLQPDDIAGKIIKDPAISDLGNITAQQVIDRLEHDNIL